MMTLEEAHASLRNEIPEVQEDLITVEQWTENSLTGEMEKEDHLAILLIVNEAELVTVQRLVEVGWWYCSSYTNDICDDYQELVSVLNTLVIHLKNGGGESDGYIN